MKKIICIILAVAVIAGTFCGCGSTNSGEKKLSIVTTIFPEYDWVTRILGSNTNADVTMLLDNGVDLHSFQPSADDIIKISTCDLFVYVGGESDSWVTDALKEATNKNMIVLDLIDVLGGSAKVEETVAGMKPENEEENGEKEYDEHIWLSLKNAAVLCDAIKDALVKLDAKNADTYTANLNGYKQELSALDGKYKSAVDNSKNKTLIFADRFPFRYLTDDYGLKYFAAFKGCSAESEADFETVTFLAKKIDELKLQAVLTLEGSNRKIAETVIASTQSKTAKILSMDSMQSTTSSDVKSGVTYLSIMQKNLDVLTDALK